MSEPAVVAAPSTPRTGSRSVREAALASAAMAAPTDRVPNGPIAARLGVSEDWIETRTGVRERRIASPDATLAGLAAEAGAGALERAGMRAAELDLILVATFTSDDLTPNTAPQVATRLGAERAGAIDVGAACTGFLAGLALACAQVESGRAKSVLLIGADLLSRFTDRDDRSTAGLFGDGAGAVLVRVNEGGGRVGPVVLGADAQRGDLIRATRAEGLIRMKGHDTFRQAVARMTESTTVALAAAGRTVADVDLFIYHQANSRIIAAVGEELSLPAERVVDYVPLFGNTSAASIPIALALAEREGRLWPGATVLMAAFGAGLTWGATVAEWGEPDD